MLIAIAAGDLAAQAPQAQPERVPAQEQIRFVPFNTFLEETRSTDARSQIAAAGSRVQSASALEEMRQHILSMYAGIQVTHSFVLDAQHFDCVPKEQQPSVRLQGLHAVEPPPPDSLIAALSRPGDQQTTEFQTLSSQFASDAPQSDRFGNSIGCEDAAIPIRRITLAEMSRYPTLRDFFKKGVPLQTPEQLREEASKGNKPLAANVHKYARAYQRVNNLGGAAILNLWRPHINTKAGQVFSLLQEWYVGGSGAHTQTAEVGWQNYPAKYGIQNSVLFIFYTADNYENTGCYNLECAGFVQTNNRWVFGAGWSHYSTVGGPQYDFSAEYYLWHGDWWLALGGQWVGYYPGAVYRHGQMTRNAQRIEYGTESAGSRSWPPQGSGHWPTTGWAQAAYQRDISYINMSGNGVWALLDMVNPSPYCYSTDGLYHSSDLNWMNWFYLGGPGGKDCE